MISGAILMSAARGNMQRPHLHIINHLEISNDGPPKERYAYLINSAGILEHDEFLFYLTRIKSLVKNLKPDNEISKHFLLSVFLRVWHCR